MGWLSAAAHLLAMVTLAQRGAFAPDGIIAALIPLTTVIWILAQAATLAGAGEQPRVPARDIPTEAAALPM